MKVEIIFEEIIHKPVEYSYTETNKKDDVPLLEKNNWLQKVNLIFNPGYNILTLLSKHLKSKQ